MSAPQFNNDETPVEYAAKVLAHQLDEIINIWVARREAYEIIKADDLADLLTSCISGINISAEPLRVALRDKGGATHGEL